jgi:dihydroxyacetone kinase
VPATASRMLVSGLGATPIMELYILYGELAKRLQAQNITDRL